jgi:hypothetical protein
MNDFDALLEEIEALRLAKALTEHHVDEEDDLAEDNEEVDATLSKAFSVQLPDGSTVEAVEGTELIKALSVQIEEQEALYSTQQEQVLKSMGGLMQLIKAQNEAILALQHSVIGLRQQGSGRKSVVSAPFVNAESFMAKALKLTSAGKLLPADVSVLELAGFNEANVPAHLINKINLL